MRWALVASEHVRGESGGDANGAEVQEAAGKRGNYDMAGSDRSSWFRLPRPQITPLIDNAPRQWASSPEHAK